VTRSTYRRATVLAAGTVAAAGLLAGCSAGQIAETAQKNPSVQGVNAQAEAPPAGSVKVRDVAVVYKDPEGYPAGGTAPLEVRIFNDTPVPVTVRVRPGEPETESEQLVVAGSVTMAGAGAPTTGQEPVASPSPTPTGEPGATASPGPTATAAPAGAPATVEVPAAGYVILTPSEDRYLQVTGLEDDLRPGESVPLVFEFSNGVELRVVAPVTPPLTPAPRGSAEVEEEEAGH
jgi:hypothetical protein